MPKAPTGFLRPLVLCALTSAAALALALAFAGAVRLGFGLGAASAALSSLAAFGLLWRYGDGGTQGMLAALVASFLTRMVLVALGLLLSIRLGGEPLAFCAAFFGLYLVHQVLEILAVSKREQPKPSEGRA